MNQSPAMMLITIIIVCLFFFLPSSSSPCSASLWPDSNPLTWVRSSERIGRSPRLQTGSSVPGRGRHPSGRHRTRRQGPAAKCPLGLPLGPQPSLRALCVGRSRCGVVVVGRAGGLRTSSQIHTEPDGAESRGATSGKGGREWTRGGGGVCYTPVVRGVSPLFGPGRHKSGTDPKTF